MSYWVYVEYPAVCDHCGGDLSSRLEPKRVLEVNYTSNTAPMWRDGGCDLREFDGKSASELLPAVNRAIVDMLARPAHHKQYEPENGWGSYDGTLKFLRQIRAACESDPDAKVRVSY